MLTVDYMKESLTKAEVAYHEFALHTRANKNGLFCFFEGERGTDNPYYVPRIKQFTKQYHPIRCSNRDSVLKVYELIVKHPEYNKYKKAFFIDRDFNKPLKKHKPPIFETPCYSIENFYTSPKAFKEILKNTFLFPEISHPFEVCITLFSKRQKEFHQATTLFNAWYSCLIEIRNSTGKKTGVRLDTTLPRGFVDFTLQSIKSNYDLKKIIETFPDSLKVSEKILKKKYTEFSKCKQHKVFRGKYELHFVLKMIELLIDDSTSTKKHLKEKIKLAFGKQLSNDQALSVFSAYAETPKELITYLKDVTT